MESNELSNIFEKHKTSKILGIVGKALNNINKDDEAVKELTDILKEEKESFPNQIRDQIGKNKPKIDFSDQEKLLNRSDVERIWYDLDKKTHNVKREEVYRMFTDSAGEYIHGLKKDMSGEELAKLIENNKNDDIIAFDPMACNKRKRINEEQRCIQRQNKEINWEATLNQIKKFAQESRYTSSMTRELIVDIAKEELPE